MPTTGDHVPADHKVAKIAVVGSFYDAPTDGFRYHRTHEQFAEACRGLGDVLASLGHTLLVQYNAPRTADRYCVEGYLAHLKRNPGEAMPHMIMVGQPDTSEELHFDEFTDEYPGLFSYTTFPCKRWDSARFKSCLDADATIIIGGAGHAEKTGDFVLGSQGVLVPIASFGGAAETILGELAQNPTKHRTLPSPLTAEILRQAWSSTLLGALRTALASPFRRPRIVIVHGRSDASVDVLQHMFETPDGPEIIVMARDNRVGGLTLAERWERLAGQADGAIVAATPDDEGRLRKILGTAAPALKPRARQNVWLEFGWAWGRLRDRERILLLIQHDGPPEPVLEIPSDAEGTRYAVWRTSPLEQKAAIMDFVESVRSRLRAFT